MDDMAKTSFPVTLKSSSWMYAFCTIGFDAVPAALVVDIDVWCVQNKRLAAFQGSGRMLQAPVLVTFIDQGVIKVEVGTLLVCIGV